MPLTADWSELQAAFTEYADDSLVGGHHTIVLSLPVSGSTARASTAVAASLLRGLVNDYFDTYETPVGAQWVSISNTGGSIDGISDYSLAMHLNATHSSAFADHADEIKTAITQALEDLPKTLVTPDDETTSITEALKHATVLEDQFVDV